MLNSRYKVAFIMITLNTPYWQYLKPCVDSLKKFALKGHDVDFIVWSDIPKEREKEFGVKIIPTEPFDWPVPTLHRYSLFLREEELLKEYDFLLYVDTDMMAVTRMGNEILGDLVGAVHPMYYIKQNLIPPYEPNEKSKAFIPRPGKVVEENGKKRFQPYYYAGGFQGGRSDVWIKAMKQMKEWIDEDFIKNNYIPIWNDESIWNRYCFENTPDVVLNPSYIYPDSLIKDYYIKQVWGRNFVPKLVTITKKHTLTQEGGANLRQMLG